MTIRFDEKIAIVTGGAMGIGVATAEKLCELGASVAILDRDEAAATLLKAGHRACYVVCDVRSEASVKEAID